MALKIYTRGSYFYIVDSLTNEIKSQPKKDVYIGKDSTTATSYRIRGVANHSPAHEIPFSEILNELGVPYVDQISFEDFYEVETGFNTASGGSDARLLEPITLGCFGQSNMDCAINGSTTGGDKDLNPHVTVWDDIQHKWVVADTDKYPFGERDAFFENIQVGTTTGNNNVAFHTAKRIQEKTKRKVRIVFSAQGGTPIERWIATDPTPTSWTAVTDILTDSGVNKLDGIIFYQGESNGGDSLTAYSGKIIVLRQQFRDIGIVDKEAPFIQAEVGANYDNINKHFFNYPEYLTFLDDAYYTVVKAKDLDYWDLGNHLTPSSVVTISDRFASAFLSLPKTEELTRAGTLSQKVAVLSEVQTSGTNGGTSIIGFQQRTLNTVVDPTGEMIIDLTANEFTLEAGTYLIQGHTSIVGLNQAALYLRNVTDNVVVLGGDAAWVNATGLVSGKAFINDIFTITEPKVFDLLFYAALARTDIGLGLPNSNGQDEKYTHITLTKL